MATCYPSLPFLKFWQGRVEVIIRCVCMILGFSAFVCAATAVNNLNANAIILRAVEVEDARDRCVATAGIVVFLGLLTVLMEGAITLLRFCTNRALNAFVDMIISDIFALVYFCFGVVMAVVAGEWRNLETSGIIYFVGATIGNSLAATSVFCFFSMCAFIMLSVWMYLYLIYEWNLKLKEALENSPEHVGLEDDRSTVECYPSLAILKFPQGCCEIVVRLVCIVLGFCTFLCAAVAVSNLNANAITFEDVEQLRDRSVATAGILLGVALGSMLTEGVICAMRFCTKGGSIAFFDMLITAGFGLLCLCLATPTAILSNAWMNMESPPEGSGNIGNVYSDVRAIADSLGAASVFGFLSMFMLILLAVWNWFMWASWNPRLEQAFRRSEMSTSDLQMMILDTQKDLKSVWVSALKSMQVKSRKVFGLDDAQENIPEGYEQPAEINQNDHERRFSYMEEARFETRVSGLEIEMAELKRKQRTTEASLKECKRSLSITNEEVKREISRVLRRQTKASEDVEHPCEYYELCARFFETLQIKDDFKDTKYNRCYCGKCSHKRGVSKVGSQGNPPKKFAVPIGLVKFGTKAPPQAEGHDVFNKWHVAYHGTSPESARSIIECGELLIPGDVTLKGATISIVPGHQRDIRKFFVSPSICYCTYGEVYAKSKIFHDQVTRQSYKAKVLLQVRIEPGSYNVGPQTVGATYQIDPLFTNDELEWSTERRKVTVIYGVLVKLEQYYHH